MKRLTILALLLFTLSGCYLKSVHPLIKEGQGELMPGLEGRWENEDQRWTFISGAEKFDEVDDIVSANLHGDTLQGALSITGENIINDTGYILIFENLQNLLADSSYFFAKVGKIEEDFYLDIVPLQIDGELTFLAAHFQPVHSFSKLIIDEGNLNVEFFKDAWIKSLIENNQIRIKHEKIEGDVLITASNTELRKFVRKYSKDEKAFDDPLIFERVYDEL